MIKRKNVKDAYTEFCIMDVELLVTPDVTKLLRGLMRQTPASMARLSSVKKNQLLKYEQKKRHLSIRDRRWLCSVFKAAGAEIFIAQGHLQVRYNDINVIVNGEISSELQQLKYGVSFREMRWGARLSQKVMQRQSGVKQHVISAIENYRHGKYHLDDLVIANRFLKRMDL